MRIFALLLFFFIVLASCIPTRIAPKIETNKVMIAKKFKRGLPKQHAFIFEDPKDANHFYTYINTKYQRNHIDVEYNVPIQINDYSYYLSFYETERKTETINLVPIVIDAKLSHDGKSPVLENLHTTKRKGHYYLVLTVFDDSHKNCLSDNYKERIQIIQFLENIRIEYLNTYNYEELLFKKKS